MMDTNLYVAADVATAKFYKQGMEDMTSSNWNTVGAMFRKTLDTGLKLPSPVTPSARQS